MLEKDGLKYSQKEFDGYKHRAKIVLEKIGEEHHYHLDLYTTDLDKEHFLEVINSRMKEGIKFIECANWCTKEQDDRSSAFVDDFIKNF